MVISFLLSAEVGKGIKSSRFRPYFYFGDISSSLKHLLFSLGFSALQCLGPLLTTSLHAVFGENFSSLACPAPHSPNKQLLIWFPSTPAYSELKPFCSLIFLLSVSLCLVTHIGITKPVSHISLSQ